METINLNKHISHNLSIAQYGSNVELNCDTCRETLVTQKVDTQFKFDKQPDAPACNMDEGCIGCGS